MLEKLKNIPKNYFSNGPKATFILSLVIMSLLITIFSMRKTLIIVIDGKESKIVTYKGTVGGALHDNRIVLGPKDKIEPGIDSKVKKNDSIAIKRAVNVEVAVDGDTLNIQSAEGNIEAMLKAEEIKLQDEDKVSPAKDSPITEGLKVDITRVESKILTDSLALDYATVVKKDDDLAKTVNKVVQEGQKGEKLVSTKIIYENGKEISRKVISETIVKEPVQKVVLQGTLGVLNLSRGSGENVLYTRSLRVRATAYYDSGSNGNAYTASGTKTKRSSSGYSTIAVDPRVIPLGTKVYVEGYGYAVAEDTGGAIKGNTIDVFFHSSSEVYNWGVKYVNIYILK